MSTRYFRQYDIDQFERLGFIVVRALVAAGNLQSLQRVAAEHLQQRVAPFELERQVQYPGSALDGDAPGSNTIRRLLQAYHRDPLLAAWAKDPELVGRVQQLLDNDQLLLTQSHHNCVMTKQPAFSSSTGWRRDTRYWCFSDDLLVNTWLALGPETTKNGGLRLIPGSHRQQIDEDRLDAAQLLRTELPINRAEIDTAIEVELAAGDVLFFHADTLHAASQNQTGQAKMAVVFSYRTPANRPQATSKSTRFPDIALGGKR